MAGTLDNYVNVDSATDTATDWGSNLDGGSPSYPDLHMPLVSDISIARDIGGVRATTFTRNSIATYLDASKVRQTATANNPRFEFGRYFEENDSTNLIKDSADMTGVGWDSTGTGTITATTVKDQDAAAFAAARQFISTGVGDNDSFSLSVSMPKLGAAPTEYPGIGLVYSGGTSIFTQVLCDAYLGTMTARVGGGVTAPGQTWVEDAGLNWRFHLTFDNNATLNNVIAALMYGSVNTDGSATWVTSTTNTTTSTFLFIQVEEWPDGTSYIPTAGATVQRVDEILTITPCPVTKDFTFYMEFVPTIDWSDIDAGFVRLFGSDDSGGDELRTIGGVGWSWTVFGGGGLLVIKQTDFVKDSVYKIAVSVRQDGANEITNLFVNGVVQIDNESDAGTLDHSDVDLDIGFYDPGLQGTCPMKVKDFAVWDYAKPPADLLILSGG